MFELAVDPTMGTEERCTHLGNQLLRGIGVVAEPLPQLPVTAARVGLDQCVNSCSAVA